MANMSVYTELKGRVMKAMKDKSPEVGILRVVLGELQRAQTEPDDNKCHQTIKKMIQSGEETYKLRPDENLINEIGVLKSLLPAELTREEILFLILPTIQDITKAKSEGQAIGSVMKLLKETGKGINSAMVASIVKSLRT
jgi:uncharacterized protein YqeY